MKNILLTLLILFQINLFSQKNISFLGNLHYNQKINDIWGYTANGKEYALVGGTTGTSIVDITNPSMPTELFFIEGDTSIWRDIKTYQDFAYVTNEEGGGLLIIDLSNLPNNIEYHRWKVLSFDYETAHNIFIDENGFAYLFGSNIENQGAFILDLNSPNRFKPPFVGLYNDRYCHDGFVRNNILWTSEIYQGDFSAVDMTNKSSPIILARQSTSTKFTHQCWLSDDNNYLITTDEKPGAYVDIYDVSDLNNIELIDKYKSMPDDSLIPHNAFFLGNDYIFNSYYRNGVTLVDATRKNNLVEIGNYDTSPFSSDNGFQGCWGVYPYLPSGNIIASDREEGLFILSPTFKRACYIEGKIIDTVKNLPINDVRVEIIGTNQVKTSLFDGSYTIGVADSGIYDIRFSLPYCQTVIVSGIELKEAEIDTINIKTACDFPLNIDKVNKKNTLNYTFSPNPFKDKLEINFVSQEEIKTLQIFDIQGKKIKEIQINATKGSLKIYNTWKKGIYIASLISKNNIFQKTIIKE